MSPGLQYDSTAYRILRFLAFNYGLHRAATVGDIAKAINAPLGKAVYQRMKCDLIGKGWLIQKTDDNTYWMPADVAVRARREVKRIHREHVQAMRAREFGQAAQKSRRAA